MADTTGEADLRAEIVSPIVTGFALQSYKLKSIIMVQKTGAWANTYFEEGSTELTNASSPVKEVPRLANIPYGEPNWTERTARLQKHAMEGVVSWEDSTTNNISVIGRTLLRVARAVAKSVDDAIWSVVAEVTGGVPVASRTNSLSITAGDEWDSGTIGNRDPVQNILDGKVEIETENYDPDAGGFLLLSPKDHANLVGNANVRNAGQFWTDSATKNGRVGQIVGLTIIKTPTVTADYAMIIIGKEAAVWKTAKNLTTTSIVDPFIKTTIRAVEMGVTQMTNPKAVTIIDNTQA